MKGKTFYLWIIILIFVVLWVPYFQNFGVPVSIVFFSNKPSFVAIYPWLLMFGVVEGALIVLYLTSVIKDVRKDEPKKFDL